MLEQPTSEPRFTRAKKRAIVVRGLNDGRAFTADLIERVRPPVLGESVQRTRVQSRGPRRHGSSTWKTRT